VLAPYILELGRNVSRYGVPTVRPLWWEFPSDAAASDPLVEDQFMLGPKYMAAPVTTRGATTKSVYFPGDASVKWGEVVAMGGAPGVVHIGGQRKTVDAPIGKYTSNAAVACDFTGAF
jgi:alpha-glucosidase (family GH31 glycosyl hydrolase)